MTTELETVDNKKVLPLPTLHDLLNHIKPELAKVLPSYLTPDRMIAIAISAIQRNPDLGRCTAMSILNCLRIAAQFGLEAGGPFGYAYLVPYWNGKTQQSEAQLIVGYKGLIKLCRDSEQIKDVEARIVYKNEKFLVAYGTTPKIVHQMKIDGRGEPVAAYSVATLADGSKSTEVMTKEEIEEVRQRSQSGRKRTEEEEKKGKKASGPWVTDEMQMWRKTVTRRHMNYLPLSQKAALAIELETRAEIDDGQVADLVQIPGVSVVDDHPKAPIQEPKRRSEATKQEKEQAEVKAASPNPPTKEEMAFNEWLEEMQSFPPEELANWWRVQQSALLTLSGQRRAALLFQINERCKKAGLKEIVDA